MRGVYRFFVDCGSMGELDGLFTADSDEVSAAIGQEIYLDEPLGKHSEVELTLSEDNITLVTQVPVVVDIMETYRLDSGINPLEALSDE